MDIKLIQRLAIKQVQQPVIFGTFKISSSSRYTMTTKTHTVR